MAGVDAAVATHRDSDPDAVEARVDHVAVVTWARYECIEDRVHRPTGTHVLADFRPVSWCAAEVRVVRDGVDARHLLGPLLCLAGKASVAGEGSKTLGSPKVVDSTREFTCARRIGGRGLQHGDENRDTEN